MRQQQLLYESIDTTMRFDVGRDAEQTAAHLYRALHKDTFSDSGQKNESARASSE